MRIIIIEPYDYNPRYDQRSLTPNPGPVMVATLLKQAGHGVEVFSEYVASFDIDEVNRADLVGISITTYNAPRGFAIARQVKKPLVFGGFHASLMPEECLQYGDYVIRGDGYSIVDLADYVDNPDDLAIDRIPNLVHKQGDRIIHNHTAARPANVAPDYSLVRDYYKFSLRQLVRIPMLVNASRGCYHHCAFCSIKAVYPDFAKKDIQVVIEDIKSQIKHQHFFARFFPKIIWITDDNFSSDKNWAKDLLKAIAELKSDYTFTVQSRIDIADDDELLKLMVAANINRVYVGIESLNQKSLDRFNKNTSTHAIEIAIAKLKDFGIDVHGLFVFGDDDFQKGDGLRVANFAKKHGFSGVLIQPLTPYPGTELYKKLETESRILHRNWQHYNGKIAFKPKNMTPAELTREIYDCYSKVFSPWRVIRFFFAGNRGWKMEFIGEALFRHFEKSKIKNYVKNN
jgi:radical SAM superfamily enzyme YgiQ (UPF0313 family)